MSVSSTSRACILLFMHIVSFLHFSGLCLVHGFGLFITIPCCTTRQDAHSTHARFR